MLFQKLLFLLKKYPLFASFIAIFLLVCLIVCYKLFLHKTQYVYVRVKVGQGFWWANTAQPSIWLASTIHKGDIAYDLTGRSLAVITDVKRYNAENSDDYETYIIAQLAVHKTATRTTFNRMQIGVGAPIDFSFPNEQFSGTVMAVSNQPFQNNSVEKTVTLVKSNAYPWEYDSIRIGDTYNDGDQVVFTVLDKNESDTSTLSADAFGNYTGALVEPRKYIQLKVKVKVKRVGNQYVFGEEDLFKIGKGIKVSTANYAFFGYTVTAMQ